MLRILSVTCCFLGLTAVDARAHFLWLAPVSSAEGVTVQAYFSEDAYPDNPALLQKMAALQARTLSAGQPPAELKFELTETTLHSPTVPASQFSQQLVLASFDYGVVTKGPATFRLKYYAKCGPPLGAACWNKVETASLQPLDVAAARQGDRIELLVRFAGEPVADAEVHISCEGLDDLSLQTDALGRCEFLAPRAGRYSVRARHIEAVSGVLDGKEFPETRHYSTLTLDLAMVPQSAASRSLPALKAPVTSFGAAVLGEDVFIYGGHSGSAHSYSHEEQGRELLRLNLQQPVWEVLAEGPPLQGLALVAHGPKLYRLGGFTARNAEGEKQDLWSQSDAAAFNLTTRQWEMLPALPEPRSSFDAAVLGDAIYVVGGWNMSGKEGEPVWHETAWKLELPAIDQGWQPLAKPPFQRRANAVAAFHGKIYSIGGMMSSGAPTREVSIYDPQQDSWTTGPELVGEKGLSGFGAAAFAVQGRLYVSTIDGNLQRLSADGTAWELLGATPTPRFFHRLLPVGENQLLVIGGASMEQGKFADLELLQVGR
jgi:N-acetylneuraminic acid mutarotase/uncharacterized GH25 family protein